MTTKVVMQVTPDGQPSLELARFALDAEGRVIATYLDAEERECFEDGIYVCTADGELRPADGRRFFDALDIAFSASTLLYVETLEAAESAVDLSGSRSAAALR